MHIDTQHKVRLFTLFILDSFINCKLIFFRYLDYLFNWQATCLSRATELLQSHETALGKLDSKTKYFKSTGADCTKGE